MALDDLRLILEKIAREGGGADDVGPAVVQDDIGQMGRAAAHKLFSHREGDEACVLAHHKEVSIKELKKYSLVLPSLGLSARSVLDEILKTCDEHLDPHLEMNDVNILLQLVESSLFTTILSQTTIMGRNELVAIPIAEQRGKMIASVLTLKGAYQKASASAFLNYFKEELAYTKALR